MVTQSIVSGFTPWCATYTGVHGNRQPIAVDPFLYAMSLPWQQGLLSDWHAPSPTSCAECFSPILSHTLIVVVQWPKFGHSTTLNNKGYKAHKRWDMSHSLAHIPSRFWWKYQVDTPPVCVCVCGVTNYTRWYYMFFSPILPHALSAVKKYRLVCPSRYLLSKLLAMKWVLWSKVRIRCALWSIYLYTKQDSGYSEYTSLSPKLMYTMSTSTDSKHIW